MRAYTCLAFAQQVRGTCSNLSRHVFSMCLDQYQHALNSAYTCTCARATLQRHPSGGAPQIKLSHTTVKSRDHKLLVRVILGADMMFSLPLYA